MALIKILLINLLFSTSCCLSLQSEKGKRHVCVPRIKRFSSSDRQHYYQCENPGDFAVLVKCPERQFYLGEKGKCVEDPDASLFKDDHSRVRRSSPRASEGNIHDKPVIEDRDILGQVVLGLGDLYDAKQDRFLTGTSLWSEKTINASKRWQNQLSSNIKYSAGKTLYEKMDEMQISASLKLDFLGGLISISGGADYYRESSSLENEETFHVIYETRSHSEVLPTQTQHDYVQVCASKDATHVVSQVLYGQRGYLSFKHKRSESSITKEVKGNLQVLVRFLFTATGMGSVDITESEKKLVESTEVRISGDFILDQMPTTFTEAIETFKKLAVSNGKSPKDMPVKPVRVQLTPLWKYCDKSTAILIRISAAMIDEAAKVLDNIEKLHIKTNTLLSTKPAIAYQAVRKNLNIYETFLRKYQIKIKGKLQTILPAIRANKGKSEADLNQLIADYLSSPIKYDKSARFLSRRNREIRAIQYLLDHFDVSNQHNIQIEDYESANDVDISLRYSSVVIFSANILQPREVTESFVNGTEIDESTFWFNSLRSVGSLGDQIRIFKEFAEANKNDNNIFYLVKINRKDATPFNVTAIKDGKFKPFQIPTRPQAPRFVSSSYNSISVEVERPNNPSVTSFYLLYWDAARGESNAMKTTLFEFSQRTGTITNLNSATFYQYRVVHCTEFGVSHFGDAGELVMTAPSSPPANLAIVNVSEDYAAVTWQKPLIIGENITINGYKISIYRGNASIIHTQQLASNVFSASFPNLLPAEKYTINVTAVTPATTITIPSGNVTKQIESEAASVTTYTFPKPPATVSVVSTHLNSIIITWNKPTIAKEAQLLEYVVRYATLVSNGSQEEVGTEKMQSALTNSFASISGLTQGTTYGFQVKVKTTKGSSFFSNMLTARTRYNFTELDKLKESMEKKMNTAIYSAINVVSHEQIEMKADIRYLLNTTSGLIPFGERYGDILQSHGDDIWFTITRNDISFFEDFINATNPMATQILVGNDGLILIGDSGVYHRTPSSYTIPVIAGYSDDFDTRHLPHKRAVFIRYKVHEKARSIINDDINRYLFLKGKSKTEFSSKFILLVTYNSTAQYSNHGQRFTFQVALASDGDQSFAVFNYARLDKYASYGVGYYDPKCGWKSHVNILETRDLVLTSNIGAKGKHVIPLKC